jgi:hypothetical protein
VRLNNQTIEGVELVLTNEEAEAHVLGPDLVLKRCRLILRTTARGLIMTRVKFVQCHIEARRKLLNFQEWCACWLQECAFHGRFVGNDFGHWPEDLGSHGGIEGGDFSTATLDGCRFVGCNMHTIRLPRWPCFTLLDPVKRVKELQGARWPGKLDIWVDALADDPPTTAAVVEFAPRLAKNYECSEVELKEALANLNGVVY